MSTTDDARARALEDFNRLINLSENITDGRNIYGRVFSKPGTGKLFFFEHSFEETIRAAIEALQPYVKEGK